ncbi:MAG: UPF0489 family protein [Peptostreptococcaceae bacterium]
MKNYKGFFIKEEVGNNIFSFEERDNKEIYVPKLIDGNLEDVLIGDKIVFNEIDEENEIKAIGLKNLVNYKYLDKDIYIFDNHNHAFYFWIKSMKDNYFNKGCTLIHIDQHKDTREPLDYNVDVNNLDDVFRYTNEVLNVGSFIKPALNKNIFSELIIIDSTYSFEYDTKDEFVLDIDLDIFSSDMDYIDYDLKIDKIRNLIKRSKTITIATSPFFIEQEKAIEVLKDIFKEI